MANATLVGENSLKIIPSNSRQLFFWIILIITLISIISNIFAVRSITKRKLKYLQKVCIFSLALADTFSVLMFATNNLDALSRELKTWVLGEFLCHFIPMGQVLGTTVSSFTLLIIAMDRYQNVNVAIISKKWNPSTPSCILLIISLWVMSSVTAYPMYMFFTHNAIQIVYVNGTEPIFKAAYMCVSIQRDDLVMYYILMAVFIFIPIITIFIWFYYKIAAIIWTHRKPFTQKINDKEKDTIEANVTSDKCSKDIPKPVIKKTKNMQVERKIRTFKIVIALMLAFTICRLPYWLFFVIKLVKIFSGNTVWNVHYTLICLNILNCALNPFLYTFLNETILTIKKINQCLCKMILCCCCFTNSDLEDFKSNNPFEVDYGQKKDLEIHKNVKNSKVKFIEVAHPPMYERSPKA